MVPLRILKYRSATWPSARRAFVYFVRGSTFTGELNFNESGTLVLPQLDFAVFFGDQRWRQFIEVSFLSNAMT